MVRSLSEVLFCHKCGVRFQTSAYLRRISEAVKTGISNDNPTAVTHTPLSYTGGRAARSTPKLLAASSGPPIMTFHQFQRKKEGTRRSHFQPKSAKKQKLKETNCKLSDNPEEYYLLYPDKSRADKLPGMEEEFTVERFKEELEKHYGHITLYLCKVTDFGNNMTSELAKVLGDAASEDEIEDTIIEHQVK